MYNTFLKQKITITILSLILTTSLIGCNRSSSSETPAPAASASDNPETQAEDKAIESTTSTGEQSYWYIRNGCSTEKQTFKSKEAMCRGLQDKVLNKNCALELRQKKFTKENCSGLFTEFSEAVAGAPTSSTVSPIHCSGHISGWSGSKIVDETIHWDRKTFQKIILSDFKDVQDAGEYSLHLLPADKNNPVPGMKIFGWFIDNNKNHMAETKIDSELVLRHKDSSLNNRDVEIKCALIQTDLKKPVYTSEEKMKITCFGSYGSIQGKKDPMSSLFEWDPKKTMSHELMIDKGGKMTPSGLKIILNPLKENGFGSIKVQTKDVDGHVKMVSESNGRIDISFEYMSAWDNRHINFTCLPTKVWNESMELWRKNESQQ